MDPSVQPFIPPINPDNSSSSSSINPQLNTQVPTKTPLNIEISNLINSIHGDEEISERIRLYSKMAGKLSSNLDKIIQNKTVLKTKIDDISQKIINGASNPKQLSRLQSQLLVEETKASLAEANTLKQLNKINEKLAINQSLLETRLQNEKKEIVDSRLDELIHRIHTFTALPSHTENFAIFKLENEMRNFIKGPEIAQFEALNYVKNAIIGIYNNKIIPHIKRAQTDIKVSPHHIIANQAALKGKASTAFFKFVVNSTSTVLADKVESINEVYVREDEGAVIKFTRNKRRLGEEAIVNGCFAIKSETGSVGSFNAKDTSIDRLNFLPFDENKQSKIYSIKGPLLESLTKTSRSSPQSRTEADLKRFSIASIHPDSLDEFNKEIDLLNRQKDYENWKDQIFEYTIPPENEYRKMTFKELSYDYQISYIPPGMQIKDAQTNEMPFLKFLETQPSLVNAFHFRPERDSKQLLDAYLSPLLDTPEKREIYEKCNRFVWFYQTHEPNGMLRIGKTTFQSLMELYLQGYQLETLEPERPIQSSIDLSLFPLHPDDLKVMFNLQWVVENKNAVKIRDGSYEKLIDLEAKPFLKEMELLKNLRADRPVVFEKVMNNLSTNSQYNAVLTGEFQTLDLHDKNIGLAPVSTPSYEKFKDTEITYKGKPYPFKEFMYLYLEDKLDPDVINSNTELKAALDSQWEFIFFDLDLSVAEDNELIQFSLNKQLGYHIPYRCDLLVLPWKYNPLSPEVISRLCNDSEISYEPGDDLLSPKRILSKDQQVRNWLKKEDSPVKQRLSEKAKNELNQLLDPLLAQYTYKGMLSQNIAVKTSIMDLQKIFKHDLANKLIDPTVADVNKIWQLLEKELGVDLTSSESEEIIEKRKRIAGDLFPRATVNQQNALIERQDRRKNYLKEVMDFSYLNNLEEAQFEQLEEKMIKFINSPNSSLSSREKQVYSQSIGLCNKQNFEALKYLYRELFRVCYPSYFNLIKVMYPLLADTYDLYALLLKDESQAGGQICNYINPINEITALAKLQQDPLLQISANRLEYRMLNVKNPQLFDVFVANETDLKTWKIVLPQPPNPNLSQLTTESNSPSSSTPESQAADVLRPSPDSSPGYTGNPLSSFTEAIHVQSQSDSDTSDEVVIDIDDLYFDSPPKVNDKKINDLDNLV